MGPGARIVVQASDFLAISDASHLSAVYFVRGNGNHAIGENIIDIMSTSYGIIVESPVGESAQGTCSIASNEKSINEIDVKMALGEPLL